MSMQHRLPEHAARGAALHRQPPRIRAGSNDTSYYDRGRVRVIDRRHAPRPIRPWGFGLVAIMGRRSI